MRMSQPMRSISNLEKLVRALPAVERERFARMFKVTSTIGELKPPASMHDWIVKHFGSEEAVRTQQVVKVTNLITVEGSLFNELRANRPMEVRTFDDLDEIINGSTGDPFCQPLEGTPEDIFGRVEGTHCVTASNVAKYDGFHGIIVFDEHNPLRFSAEAVKDYLDTALAWACKAHCVDREASYFFFMWNCLWRSGASILHGHAQMALGRGMHYAKVEHLRRAALLYRVAHGVNYFDDLYAIHKSLGLAVDNEGVRIVAYLTPVKEKEIVLISDRLDDELKYAVYRVLRCFVGTLGVRSFNLALQMRPIDSVPEDWRGFPVVIRVLDRGNPNEKTADIGAMELYGSSVISSDPFKVAQALSKCLSGKG